MNKKNVVLLLDGVLAEKLSQDIADLMYHERPCSPRGANFRCEFCQRTDNTNQGQVTHAADCPGEMYLKALTPTCFACNGSGKEPDYAPEGRTCIWCEGSGRYRSHPIPVKLPVP